MEIIDALFLKRNVDGNFEDQRKAKPFKEREMRLNRKVTEQTLAKEKEKSVIHQDAKGKRKVIKESFIDPSDRTKLRGFIGDHEVAEPLDECFHIP